MLTAPVVALHRDRSRSNQGMLPLPPLRIKNTTRQDDHSQDEVYNG